MSLKNIFSYIITIMVFMIIVMLPAYTGYLVGYDDAQQEIRKKLVQIKCGRYNPQTGEFEIKNLINQK
jgi:hypothetical protein